MMTTPTAGSKDGRLSRPNTRYTKNTQYTAVKQMMHIFESAQRFFCYLVLLVSRSSGGSSPRRLGDNPFQILVMKEMVQVFAENIKKRWALSLVELHCTTTNS